MRVRVSQSELEKLTSSHRSDCWVLGRSRKGREEKSTLGKSLDVLRYLSQKDQLRTVPHLVSPPREVRRPR